MSLHRVGITFDLNSILKGTLYQRIKASFERGSKGYIIVNPHNPTGLIADR